MRFPIEIPPGVVDTPTKTSKSANWQETNLMRWVNNRLTPVGGWEKLGYSAVASKIRAMHRWTTNSGINMVAYLCEGHCYVDQGDGVLTNISPVVPIVPPNNTLAEGGYGDNLYSLNLYGTPRPDKEVLLSLTPAYCIDNWGEDLVVMTGSDGRLLRWKPSTPATPLVAVTNAPVGNRCFVVTPQRHVMLFGAGGIFNRFAWCDQEDIENWNYADVTSLAGFFDVQPASPIVTAGVAGDDVVFWTAAGDMFVSRNIGYPYVYNCELVTHGPVPTSPMSIGPTPVGFIFVAQDGVWRYEAGSVSPVACPVWSWVAKSFSDDFGRYYSNVVPVDAFSELWWFFPDADNRYNNKYIQWNYKEGWWSMGRMARLCGVSSAYDREPLMSDGDSVYKHESGLFYATEGLNELPWAKTFNINIGGGSALSTVMRLLPDVDGDMANISFELEYNIPRAGPAQTNYSTGEQFMQPNGYVAFRDTGRDFRVTLRQTVQGIRPWTMGETQLELLGRGAQ